MNHFLVSKFDVCWIPDAEGSDNLSGELSHKYRKPGNATYIGPLSRFSFHDVKKEIDLLILLSGPEPQRTLLENILQEQVRSFLNRSANRAFKVLLIRGVSEGMSEITTPDENFSIIDCMNSEQLNAAMLSADLILSRPGYSTIMDLAVLGKKAIFIPTPGQTEQEYLATHFKRAGIFYSEPQEIFDLNRALIASANYHGLQKNRKPISHIGDHIYQLLGQLK